MESFQGALAPFRRYLNQVRVLPTQPRSRPLLPELLLRETVTPEAVMLTDSRILTQVEHLVLPCQQVRTPVGRKAEPSVAMVAL